MNLIDSHVHLDAAEFDADRDDVLARSLAAGVHGLVVPAVAASGWGKLRQLARESAAIFPAYGLHPMYLAEHRPVHLDELAEWIAREKPVAVGECGLDFFVEGLDRDAQRRYFVAQLELARDSGLPVIVHARHAVDEVIASVRRVGRLRGVVHSFGGSAEQARQLHALGFLLGIGGAITWSRATRLRAVVAAVPLDQLLLESDAPDQPSASHRGERNEPAWLPEILTAVANARGEPEQRVAEATRANARALFQLS